jgi:hypothetical protein
MPMRWILYFIAIVGLAQAGPIAPFGIHVIDDATGRGIPLIELRTVNDIRLVSDNAGWIAFAEPGLMDREVWFYLSHHPGYAKEKDGFGYTGARFKTVPGARVELKLKRTNIAERIGRSTGQGMYRHSELLELPCPLPNINPAGIMGQDSVQALPYQGRIFWLWGDTNVPHYPLGNFQTTAATTPVILKPELGISFDYYMDAKRRDQLRHMLPIKDRGAVWLFGLLSVSEQGRERLLAHYSRHISLSEHVEHGLAIFDDEIGHFTIDRQLDQSEKWRFPRGHAVCDGDWFYFSDGFLYTRSKANLASLRDPAAYEALHYDPSEKQWAWQRQRPPTTQADEAKLIAEGKMSIGQARYAMRDSAGKPVMLHGGSVQWNAHRNCWVLIGLQRGTRDDPSPLGEVWYAESKAPDGPWVKTIKIASHPRYSYYNPVHHGFLDAEGGRYIYFEGTYSLEFSGNPMAPAHYDYNQLMYRLDLNDPRLTTLQN